MQSPTAAQKPSRSSLPTSKQQKLTPKLPIGSRGEGGSDLAPSPKAHIAGLATPSRKRNPGPSCSPIVATPTQVLLSSDASGGATYREQLRASGNQALLQVREGARSCRATPAATPVALADKIAAPSFGTVPTPSTAGPTGFGGSPLATMDQQVPLVFVTQVGGTPYAAQQATPSPFAFADISAMSPMAGVQCVGGQSGMATMTSFHCPSNNGPTMAPAGAMAMPHMMGNGMTGEELAAQLRAAAPDVYED